MSWRIARSTPLVAECQPEAFCPWAVPTDTYGRGGNMDDRSVALTWSSAVAAVVVVATVMGLWRLRHAKQSAVEPAGVV